ncbi:MAG TPA: hypothetical protein VK992_06990 [Candidatus Caenarcaniphilales bacterium]|nr:hypothetical protein [Candidatus Caenarcaniphilales bacterium]
MYDVADREPLRCRPRLGDIASVGEIQLTVIGGSYSEQLSPEEAEALGRDEADHDAGQEQAQRDRLAFTLSLGTGVSLTEGDRVILFLRYGPLFEGLLRTYWIAGDAVWKVEGSQAKPASEAVLGLDVDTDRLRTLGLALSLQTGRAQDPIPDVTPEP